MSLEASRGRVRAQKASRAVPVPGPTADRGAWGSPPPPKKRKSLGEVEAAIVWYLGGADTRGALEAQHSAYEELAPERALGLSQHPRARTAN